MEKVKQCHNLLTNVYDNCEFVFKQIQFLYPKIMVDSYNKHYIKIEGKYELQKYYMPVISVIDIGDICFNLDGVSLEFFLDRTFLLNKCDFDMLLNSKYDVEIYDANDSTIDIYEKNMSLDSFINKLKNWNSKKIGITINCQNIPIVNIIDVFKEVYIILGF